VVESEVRLKQARDDCGLCRVGSDTEKLACSPRSGGFAERLECGYEQ
jgi:hypothetical protein